MVGLNPVIGVYKKRRLGPRGTLGMPVHREKAASCKPRKRTSEENKPSDIWILAFQHPDCEQMNLCCLNSPVCGVL